MGTIANHIRKFHLMVYQDMKKEWRWRLQSTNGKIMADSAEGYVSKDNLHRAIAALPLDISRITIVMKNDPANKSRFVPVL